MRRLLGILIVLTWASGCSAHSSIAYGYNGPVIRFVVATDAPTAAGAQIDALRNCRSAGLDRCGIVSVFENTCMSVASSVNGLYNAGEGSDQELAKQQALSACNDLRRSSCGIAAVTCDGAPPPEPPSPETDQQTASEQPVWFGFGPPFFREAVTELAISGIAQLVLFVCCIWIFVSIVATTSIKTLKWEVSISAWIALPTALVYAVSVTLPGSGYFPSSWATILYLWTVVFVALIIGGELRRQLSFEWRKPGSLSLPLATLAFTIVSEIIIKLFIRYGTLPELPDCPSPPYSPFSVCGYSQFEALYFSATLFLILIMCGAMLPAGSNLVLAYDHLNDLARKSFANFAATRRERRAQREIERTNQIVAEPSASYPVPAIYETETVDKMCLKLKRSQRSGLFGKPTFVLDARMEVTTEEAALVRKYGLGDDVIYESSSRQRRKEATLAQLEMTRDTPGYSEPATKQLLGLGKTLYRLTRAGVSATAAALSLRITVRSLMSGVHVECKSMGELLDAEKAIVEAAQNLRSYLDVAATFDGREEIIEF